MPPKKPAASAPKKTAAGAKAPVKTVSNKGTGKKVPTTGVASSKKSNEIKKSDSKAKAEVKKEKVWTKQDGAARTIQTSIRGFLARKELENLKSEKQKYSELMDKLENEACIQIAKQRQKEAEAEALKEAEERKRKAEEKKRIKRMLEAAFDGDIDEMLIILKEVRDNDDKLNVSHDVVGDAIRMRHQMNMIDCEDAHGNTPLSEASSGGGAEAVKWLADMGADPNSRGQFERTPLYRAAFAGHLDCCEMLLQYGGDPRLYASDGQTPENVSSLDPIKELFNGWDMSQTDVQLEKIEKAKEVLREKEKARRESEKNALENEMAEVQKAFDVNQMRINKLTCELNKRIDEHDTAPAMGFDKPEITLQAIHDAEASLESAKIDYDKSKELLRELKMKEREQIKDAADAGELELVGLKITIQELPEVILRDVGNKIKDSGKWPLVIDTSNRTPTFLRYQDTNYINALMPKDVEANPLRMAILGAIRYGKPLVIDMMEVDMYSTLAQMMNDNICTGLMEMMMNKTITNEENYMKLVRDNDGPEYSKENFNLMRLQRFSVIFITKNIFPSDELMDLTFPIRIHIPEF